MLQVELEEKLLNEIKTDIEKNKNIDIYQLMSLLAGSEDEGRIKEVLDNIQKLLNGFFNNFQPIIK